MIHQEVMILRSAGLLGRTVSELGETTVYGLLDVTLKARFHLNGFWDAMLGARTARF